MYEAAIPAHVPSLGAFPNGEPEFDESESNLMAQRKLESDISLFNEFIERLRREDLCNRKGGCAETQDCLDVRRSVLAHFEKCVDDEHARLTELRASAFLTE